MPLPAAIRRRRAAVDDPVIAPFGGCHRQDDGLDSIKLALVDLHVLDLSANAGKHPQKARHTLPRGQFLDLAQLLEEVLEREVGRPQLGLHLGGFLLVELFLCALDQAHHVAHAEDPRSHPIGMERLELVELLAH